MENIKTVIADLNNEQHAAAYLSLMSHYASDPMGGAEDLSVFAKENLVEALLARNDVFIVLIFIANKPAALLTAIEGFSTFACKPLLNVHDVTVHNDFRGKKLTRILFEKIEEVAKQRDCCKITLEVLSGNTIACKAYRSLGFSDYQLDPEFGSAVFWTKKLSK